jgi:RNA polymerase sigma-70 factor (ECF subfamily)
MTADLPPDLDRFRGRLTILAEIELSPWLRAKVDPADIVQQTMLEAHRDIKAFRGTTEAELYGWLKTILIRNLLNAARHHGAEMRDPGREQAIADRMEQSSLRLEQFLASEQTSPSQQAIHNEQVERLLTGLAQLLEGERAAILLKHFQDWSLAKISAHLGRPPDAVAGLLKRGLKKLRLHLQEKGE